MVYYGDLQLCTELHFYIGVLWWLATLYRIVFYALCMCVKHVVFSSIVDMSTVCYQETKTKDQTQKARTKNWEPKTENQKLRTKNQNREPKTVNQEPKTKTEN